MGKNSFNTEYVRNCPKCECVIFYNNTSSLNRAIKNDKLCRRCAKDGIKLPKNHEETVTKKCEKCTTEFTVTWKYRNQRFCSTKCMQAWRTDTAWTTSICQNCGNEFKKYKKWNKTFCSQKCSNGSDIINNKRGKLWQVDNPMNNQFYIDKIKETKLEKYGDENYNNTEKNKITNLERYGVSCTFFIPGKLSNGKRISKGQRELYNSIKQIHSDALLEHYLPDVGNSVDIFIPSENKIIEYFGRYWHCDPIKYSDDYYNKVTKKTAKQIWDADKNRINKFIEAGYGIEVVWEK